MYILADNYNRFFSYLRLSITDLCNFNCQYCLPDAVKFQYKNYLSIDEIYNLVSAFVELGVNKVRLTGGEPTTRKDFLSIGEAISSIGIKSLVFTTNGYKLVNILDAVCKAGFSGVNISLDTLNRSKFYMITKRDYFDKVFEGVFWALKYNINVKINVVLSSFFTFDDFENFYSLLKYKNLIIRFIDQMEVDSLNKDKAMCVKSDYLVTFLKYNGWQLAYTRNQSDGPALIFEHYNFLGKIGIISPYSKSFCLNCNRLRVSSTGDLFLCLFGGKVYPLRNFLKSSFQKNDLQKYLIENIKFKDSSHFLHDYKYGFIRTFSSIGG